MSSLQANAALMMAGVMFTGGLTAVVMKKLGAKFGTKELFQKENPKEEIWAK